MSKRPYKTGYRDRQVTPSLPHLILSLSDDLYPPGSWRWRQSVRTPQDRDQVRGGPAGQDREGHLQEALRPRDHQLSEEGIQAGGSVPVSGLPGSEDENPQGQSRPADHEDVGAGDGGCHQEAGAEHQAGGGAAGLSRRGAD